MKFSKFMDRYGWPTLNTGAAITGTLFGGGLGAAAAVGTTKMVQGVTSPKKRQAYKEKPLKSVALDTAGVLASYVGGSIIGPGMKSSEAAVNAAGNAAESGAASAAGSAGSGAAASAGKVAGQVGSKSAVSTSSKVGEQGVNNTASNLLMSGPKKPYGMSYGSAGNNLSNDFTYIPPSSTSKELVDGKGYQGGINKVTPVSKDVNDVLNGGTGLKKTTTTPPGGDVKMSSFEKEQKAMDYINMANTAVQIGTSVKGLHDLRNMEAPKVGAIPTVQPREIEDTVSAQKRAQEENIETALANKRRIDLATGKSDSSEDAILEMTAMNNLSGNIEKVRTDRETRIADEQFRADSQNQGLAANAMMASAQMNASFNAMRGQMESQLLGTLVNAPSQYMSTRLGNRKVLSDRYDSLMDAYTKSANDEEKAYFKKRMQELEKLQGYA